MQIRRTSRFFYLWLLIFMTSALTLISQDRPSNPVELRKFEGLYIGINTGLQSIFSEAIINELSVPQQDSRWTAEFFIAHRWQFLNDRIVFGLEVQIGLADGNLNRTYGIVPELNISFNNSNQAGLGYTFGYVWGPKQDLLLYTYLYQTRRNFDITLSTEDRILLWQSDIQTALRYGLGIEYNLDGRFSLRAAIGTQNPDLNNGIGIDRTPELSLGIIYQF